MNEQALWDRIYQLEQQVSDLRSRQMNMAGRGVLEKNTDDKKIQKQTISGLYGERLEDVERVETFGLTSMPPEGSDAYFLSMNGNRDSLLLLSTTSPDHRPTGSATGSTTLYDVNGTTLVLDGSGNIVITCAGNITIEAGGDFQMSCANFNVDSGGFSHNGVYIGERHTHTRVTPGGSLSGPPPG